MPPLVNDDTLMTPNKTWVERPWPIVTCDFGKIGVLKNMHATQVGLCWLN